MYLSMTIITQYYRVAGFVFAIEAPHDYFDTLANFKPFRIDETEETKLFIIRIADNDWPSLSTYSLTYTDRSDEDMPRIEVYKTGQEWLFAISQFRDSESVAIMHCSEDFKENKLYIQPQYIRFAIDNAAMLLFAFCTTALRTLLFHSSVTVREGKAYMFLGHSGTGKSTHSRQWMKAFSDAWLLNDDNPIVRLLPDGTAQVYGSPWSGKTPCYKSQEAPVQAIVQLAQAPQNSIEKLRMVQAYPHILSSISGLKTTPYMMDDLYESIAALLEEVPVYKLDCLPNEQAAQLCYEVCSEKR